jgi:hypothetical protein
MFPYQIHIDNAILLKTLTTAAINVMAAFYKFRPVQVTGNLPT